MAGPAGRVVSLAAPDAQARFKQAAAEHAVGFVQPGMVVGLGTGSTAAYAVARLAELLRRGELRDIVAVATSKAVWEEAARQGIPMLSDDLPREIDVTIDGADEVDPQLDLIKGGGGALLREKIVAEASRRDIIVVDESKLSPRLGTARPLPVEVLPYGWRSQVRYLESLGATVTVRRSNLGGEFHSDQGNLILDCGFGPIDDAARLARELSARAGIVEHGLFLDLTDDVIVGSAQGIAHLRRQGPSRAGGRAPAEQGERAGTTRQRPEGER